MRHGGVRSYTTICDDESAGAVDGCSGSVEMSEKGGTAVDLVEGDVILNEEGATRIEKLGSEGSGMRLEALYTFLLGQKDCAACIAAD